MENYIKIECSKESLINEYTQQNQELLEHYPQGWWSSAYCYWGELLVNHIYKSWKRAGHTDQEFEDVFGGDPETEIIFDIFRPTAHLSTYDYHGTPSPTPKQDNELRKIRDKLSESEKLLWDIKHSDSSTVYLSKQGLKLKEYLKNLDQP